MNKIKDFFYNKNDIIVVLLIIAVAAFVIYDRMDVIMNYSDIKTSTAVTDTQEPTDTDTEDIDITPDDVLDETADLGDETAAIDFTIDEKDTLSKVSEKLEKKGLIESADEFTDYVVNKGKDTALITGSYEIKKGSSKEEILNTITK